MFFTWTMQSFGSKTDRNLDLVSCANKVRSNNYCLTVFSILVGSVIAVVVIMITLCWNTKPDDAVVKIKRDGGA